MKLTLKLVVMLMVFCNLAAAQQEPHGKVVKGKAPATAKHEKDFSKRPKAKPISAAWISPKLKLAEEINLTSATADKFEAQRVVKGGEVVTGGWKATDKLDLVKIELKRGFTSEESGAIELDMTNLDFPAQVTGRKHHFFNLYSHPSGDHFVQPNNFFTLRGGSYKDKEGNRGIKVLWRGGGERGELAPFATRKVWDAKATYTWRAEWTKNELVVFLNGERIFGPAEFKDRDKQMPLKYIFLSMDGITKPVWFGFAGPVYKQIRVYREALR